MAATRGRGRGRATGGDSIGGSRFQGLRIRLYPFPVVSSIAVETVRTHFNYERVELRARESSPGQLVNGC